MTTTNDPTPATYDGRRLPDHQPQKVLEVNPPSVVPERLLLTGLVILTAVTAVSVVYLAMVLHQFVTALQQLQSAFGG